MSPAMRTAVNAAVHDGYVAAEVMRLCASGLEQHDDSTGALSAFRMLAENIERATRELDEAQAAEPFS